ncbi:hypothetical protein ACG1BZ_20765 [Microbulbifer sp. CNSA002]|uniref:hypothetical protein n=1 Tax=Microbulbifer sp. CNSA002 TaxID=3373604 RepID=UPI0039B501F2
MPEPDTNIIRRLLNESREHDLLDFMEWDLVYNREDLLENLPGKNGDRERDMDELYTTGLAVDHIRCVVNYDHEKSQVLDGNMVYTLNQKHLKNG